MTKIFISQPMKGLSEEEIQKTRNDIIEEVCKRYDDDISVLDSYFEDYTPNPDSNVALKYLAKSIDILADADLLVLGKGWNQNRGCKIEAMCAELYDIPRMEVMV